MSDNPQNHKPAGLVFGSITQQTADGQGGMGLQSSQVDIYWPPSPGADAPHSPILHSPTRPTHQSPPPSRSVTPTLGQFQLTNTQDENAAQFYLFNAPNPIPVPHVEPQVMYRDIQPPSGPAPNPFPFAAAPFQAHTQLPAQIPPLGACVVHSRVPADLVPIAAEPPNRAPENTQPNYGYRYMHGPLQAERLEQRTERAQKQEAAKEEKRARAEQRAAERQAREAAAQEEKERKAAEKAAKEAAKAAKEAAAKEEKERKAAVKAAKEEAARLAKEAAAVEKAVKEVKAREAKAAKEAAKEKEKGKLKDGRQPAGDSDTEIKAVGNSVKGADIKPIEMKTPTKKWSDNECVDTAKHIASKWATFKLKQTCVFKEVSKDVLRGSKTETQVANWWGTQWKKFKACLRREVHTGGGDGDDLDKDANQEEDPEDDDSDLEILPDESQAPGPIDETGGSKFTQAQLDAFENSKVYRIILKVAKDDPEAVKQEEFDSARAFSDSETGIPGPSKSKSSSHSTDDSDIENALRQTVNVVSAAVSTMAESRKAAAESATRKEEREAKREEREIKAATEEETYQKRQLDIEEEKRSDLQRYNERQHELLDRRLRMEEQDLRDRRRKDAIGMLSHENKYVRDEGERILKAIAKEEEQAVNKTKP